jgi:shikimate kinase
VENSMQILCLIGMSGSGKTFWSKRLAQAGYRVISCDGRIEQKLRTDLDLGGQRGIESVAAWMGWPDSATYREREKKYLECETTVMKEILAELEIAGDEKIVVDSTGSVVYTGDEICQRLRQLATVIYLEASPAEQAMLIDRYLKDPKPVLWEEHFVPKAGEKGRDTAARCYPKLIEYRGARYETYAHHILPVAALSDPETSSQDFLDLIRKACTAR